MGMPGRDCLPPQAPNRQETKMPKAKTKSSVKKRFKITATGKVKRGHSHLRHILTSKAKGRKRKLGTAVLVDPADTPKIKRMIPY